MVSQSGPAPLELWTLSISDPKCVGMWGLKKSLTNVQWAHDTILVPGAQHDE